MCFVTNSFKGRTVLVVEDDWLLREDLVGDLRREGWTVLEAATGAGAIAALREADAIDLLITDIRLADAVTGWDVAEAFRSVASAQPRHLCVRKSSQPRPAREGQLVSVQADLSFADHAGLPGPGRRQGQEVERVSRAALNSQSAGRTIRVMTSSRATSQCQSAPARWSATRTTRIWRVMRWCSPANEGRRK